MWAAWASRSLDNIDADLVHISDGSHAYVVPQRRQRPVIVTAHDVIPALRASGRFGGSRGSVPARCIVAATADGLRRADRVVAVSKRTAADLREVGARLDDRVDIVPCSLPPKGRRLLARAVVDWSERRERAPYVLHVGHGAFYKSRDGVVRAFAAGTVGTRVNLVLAGAPPSRSLLSLIDSLGLVGRVTYAVSPNDLELEQLYRGASLFLFPSVYEGFGLPPLEAMAAGCPIVCSRGGALPEVVGDAAIMAQANDISGLARSINRVLCDESLALDLIDRGRRRAGEFTVEKMGKGLIASYRAALSRRRDCT